MANEQQRNLHARMSVMSKAGNALAVTLSHRQSENSWRRWNQFESNQISLRTGWLSSDNSELETELSYTHACKHTARDSDIAFFNSRLTVDLGELIVKPQPAGPRRLGGTRG